MRARQDEGNQGWSLLALVGIEPPAAGRLSNKREAANDLGVFDSCKLACAGRVGLHLSIRFRQRQDLIPLLSSSVLSAAPAGAALVAVLAQRLNIQSQPRKALTQTIKIYF